MNSSPDLTAPRYVSGNNLLAGKTVVVTAAAGAGIGSWAARRALEEGAKAVVIGDIHKRRLNENLTTLGEEFGPDRVAARICDVTKEEDIQGLLDAADNFDGVDVMINNAGLGGDVSILDMTDEQWAAVLDITLTGTFRSTRAAAKRMVSAGRNGAIINNASVVGWRAQAGQAHYGAAKAGVMALTRTTAMDLAEHGIRVNAVSPSIALHPFLEKVSSPELLSQLKSQEAFGRAAEPWEIANVMIFLASEYSAYMTGEVVSVSSQRA